MMLFIFLKTTIKLLPVSGSLYDVKTLFIFRWLIIKWIQIQQERLSQNLSMLKGLAVSILINFYFKCSNFIIKSHLSMKTQWVTRRTLQGLEKVYILV